jgi:hypothetical protein
MPLPPDMLKRYLNRFDELILEGDAIQKNVEIKPGGYDPNQWGGYEGGKGKKMPDKVIIDWPRLVKWKTNSISLLHQVIPIGHPHRDTFDAYTKHVKERAHLDWAISTLKGIRDDFEKGFLGDLSKAIEAEIAANYMGQAEELLKEGQRGKFDHVPAAVLAGAVLEKALRTLCERQEPKVSLVNSKGEPKTLNPLIDDLKKAGAFAETKAKQLRAWAAIRNDAAHGQFDQFVRSDVEQLVHGVNNFLAEYL